MRRFSRLLYLTCLSTAAVLAIAPAAFAQADGDRQACETQESLGETVPVGDLAQVATAVFALAALCIIPVQLRREGLRHSADLILQRRDRYFSEEGRKLRQAAAKSISSSRNYPGSLQEKVNRGALPPEAELLDFFNRLGLLVQRRVLDERMVESAFYNSIHKYCWAAKGYISQMRDRNRTTWVELDHLHREIHFIAKDQSNPRVPLWFDHWILRPGRRSRWLKYRHDYFHGVLEDEKPYANEQDPESKLVEWLKSESKLLE